MGNPFPIGGLGELVSQLSETGFAPLIATILAPILGALSLMFAGSANAKHPCHSDIALYTSLITFVLSTFL